MRERSGPWLRRLLYGSQLIGLALVLVAVVAPFDTAADVLLGALFGALAVATAVGLWRARTDDDTTHLGTAEDITYDPFADPGQAARDRWERAVDRLPGGDDEGD